MIRINLLPQAKRPVRGGQTARGPSGDANLWAGVYLVGVVVWGAILAALYFMKASELEQQIANNQRLEAEIQEKRTKSARLDEVRAELEQSYALERVVSELNKGAPDQCARWWSSALLSVNRGPTIDPAALEALRRENPHAGFNASWDPHRLWLAAFEEENRECRIQGLGRTNEDVAEFLKRLTLSELFSHVTLQRTAAVHDQESDLDFIGFELTCRVTY